MESKSTGPGSLIGATLGGYEVVALIGRGAMGTVYLARDLKLNRLVALKVLLGTLAKTKSLVKQFHQEAQAAAPLNHPGIVRVYSAGTENGIPFIVMEYVDGEPLDKFLQRKGKVKWDVALHICSRLAQALESAHKNGIVHRDIKPSNIMLDKQGGVRLMDFGIASLQTESGGGGHNFLGTPQYMSPEQARNGEVGPTSDLYSVGVTLYQLIAGEMPFTGESSLALINSICNDEAPRLNIKNADVPDDVARFVAYLMGKTPRQRPANAKVVHGMVTRLLQQKGELNSMSDTITSFIQTEMEVSPFSSLHQKPAKVKLGKTREEVQESRDRRNRFLLSVLRIFLIVLAGLGAYAFGLRSTSTVAIDQGQPVPGVDALNFHRVEAGLTILELTQPDYTVNDLHWIGHENSLWLELKGDSAGMGHGTVGGIGVNLTEGRGYFVMPMQSPLMQDDVDSVYLDSMQKVDFLRDSQTDAGASSFLFAASDRATDEVVILSRVWNKSYANPTVLLRVPRAQWVWREDHTVLSMQYGNALLHPERQTAFYVLYDPENSTSYLSEQSLDVEEHDYSAVGVLRTSSSNYVIPDSLHYVPRTEELLYWRKREGVGAELWKLSNSPDDINGIRLLSGVMGDDYAVSPDGSKVALQFDDGQGGGAELVIASMNTGTILERLGDGKVSRHAWHPTEPYLVIQREIFQQGSLTTQLVAVSTRDSKKEGVLTHRENGVQGVYALSPDGQQLAAVDGMSELPSVLVWDWPALDLP